MTRRILVSILTLALIFAALPITPAQAATSGQILADAYEAYYEVIMEAVDAYGIAPSEDPNEDFDYAFELWIEKASAGEYSGQGVYYAELIYFGDSVIPQLLFIYDGGYGPGRYVCSAYVFGYSSAGLDLYSADGDFGSSYLIGGDSPYGIIRIATDQSGVQYLVESIGWYDPEEDESGGYDTYHTVKNGKWVVVPETEIDIVSMRDIGYAPDTVHKVIAELKSLKAPVQQDALPSAWKLNVNGGALRGTDMYNILGSNYLKIRDIASLLDGTEKQFNITVDGRTVNLIPGVAYEARGDEMTPNPNAVKTTTAQTTFSFTLDGKPIELTAYLIAGSNYVRIRDVLKLFDVFVDYNAALREFYIDTSKGYVDN